MYIFWSKPLVLTSRLSQSWPHPLSCDQYQIILLGNQGTCVWITCPRLLPNSAVLVWLGVELRTSRELQASALTIAPSRHTPAVWSPDYYPVGSGVKSQSTVLRSRNCKCQATDDSQARNFVMILTLRPSCDRCICSSVFLIYACTLNVVDFSDWTYNCHSAFVTEESTVISPLGTLAGRAI